jgi:hypothetical protein
MGEICRAHGNDKKCIQNTVRKTYLEDLGVNGRITLKWK